MIIRRQNWCLAGVMAMIVAGSVSAQTDSIKPRTGRDIRCVVRSTTPQGIQYELNGQPHEISVAEVDYVEYTGEPNELGRARTRLNNGQYMDCLTELQKIDAAKLSDLMKAEYEFIRAGAETKRALVEGTTTPRDAAMVVNQFLNSFPNSYHFYDATNDFAWLAFHSGELNSAAKSFETLAQSSVPLYALKGHLGATWAALEQQQLDVAQNHVQAILGSEANDNFAQDAKLIGQCLSARILAGQNQIAPAITQLEQIIKNENPDRKSVFACCYNSLGICHIAAGELKAAERDFLHTDLLFGSESDMHAEALYYLNRIWSQLNEVDRALKAKQVLSQQYRNSYWAAKN